MKSSLLDLSGTAQLAMRKRRVTSVSPGCTGCSMNLANLKKIARVYDPMGV